MISLQLHYKLFYGLSFRVEFVGSGVFTRIAQGEHKRRNRPDWQIKGFFHLRAIKASQPYAMNAEILSFKHHGAGGVITGLSRGSFALNRYDPREEAHSRGRSVPFREDLPLCSSFLTREGESDAPVRLLRDWLLSHFREAL